MALTLSPSTPFLAGGHYTFDLTLPSDRSGHHVPWVAWQPNESVGEVFFSTSDPSIEPPQAGTLLPR